MSGIRWHVADGDGADVGAIVLRAGGDARAIADGRVFVGRRRARGADEAVRAGDEVTIAPPRAENDGDVTILARSNDLIAVAKPAGIPTIADHRGASHSLLAVVARIAGVEEDALHATSRLDRDVSGVVVFALTKGAADRLARAREDGTYVRRYVAVASRAPSPNAGSWDAPIGVAKDPRHRAASGRDAIAARSLYRVVALAGSTPCALLALAPITGRTHQLRVHAAHAGAPLLGDKTYGGPTRHTLASGRVLALPRILLHCAKVSLPGLDVAAPITDDLAAIWLSLGGEPGAWDIALSCSIEERK